MDENYDDNFDYYYDLEEMQKISQALINLVNYGSMIYDLTMNKMARLEKLRLQNSNEYYKHLKKLRILNLKEQRILDNICGQIDIEDFESYINSLCEEYTDDERKKVCLFTRIRSYFNSRDLENSDILDSEKKDEMFRHMQYIKDIQLDFFRSKKECSKKRLRLLEYKYYMGFISPYIGIELLYTGFNLNDSIRLLDKEKAHLLGVDLNTYQVEKLSFTFDYAEALIDALIHESRNDTVDQSNTLNSIDFIAFIIKKLPLHDLMILKKENEKLLDEDTTKVLYKDITVLQKIIDLLTKELMLRKKFDENKTIEQVTFGGNEIGENEIVENIPEQLIDDMFKLIKQVSVTYDAAMNLCLLEISNKQNTDEFQIYLKELEQSVNKEKELSSKIEIANSEKEVIADIINNHINLIADLNPFVETDLEYLCDSSTTDDRSEVIRKRIFNLLSDLHFIDDSVYKNSDVPNFIIQSHLIEVLKEFEMEIGESDNKTPLIITKYEEILINNDLTDDFIMAGGKIPNMVSFDDETLATLLEIDLEEYQFDKSELLYNYVNLTVQEIMENDSVEMPPLENARLMFKGLYISIAAESIQDGLVEIIYEDENVTDKKELEQKTQSGSKKTLQKKYQGGHQ